ncbi:hypothetical protein L7F22_067158 [Adiantum nelumboides]|nr:hypothetical protein [Adiantum nelumboides]
MGKSWHEELVGYQKYYAKLARRYYGPFQIPRSINETAYQLKLSSHWPIHNAFHVKLFKAYKGDPPQEPILDDPPEFEGPEEILQPEHIIRHEDKVLRNGKVLRKYLIKLKNYPFEDAKWMQEPQWNGKAKELQKLADNMVTLGKEGNLFARRKAAAVLRGDLELHKLFAEIAERYRERVGGYTRVLRTRIRQGDAATMAYIE